MASQLQEFLGMLPHYAGRGERVEELLREARFTLDELAPYVFFREQFYTRNLIYADKHFEVLTLCWQQGQQTPIHDHHGSQGWAYIVQGSLDETIYRVELEKGSAQFSLEKKGERLNRVGEVSYIDDKIGCHQLLNTKAESCISLHIYSPMIPTCRYYSLAPREIKEKKLCYFSEKGKVLQS